MEGERAEYELYARLGTRRGLKRGEGWGGVVMRVRGGGRRKGGK